MRKRLWALLILVTTTLIVVAAVAYVSSSAEPDWYEATSPSGRYVAEFPGPPTTRTLTAPDTTTSSQVTVATSDDFSFGLSEAPLNGADPRPLDEAVDASIERVRASTGAGATLTEISPRKTGDFEGVESREFRVNVIDGQDKSTISSLVFYRDGVLVQALVVDERADLESADRFLSSVASRH